MVNRVLNGLFIAAYAAGMAMRAGLHWLVLALMVLSFLVGRATGAEVGPYVPTIAAAGGMASIAAPAPLPAPAPGNTCPDCNGKGWNGDGTIRNKCEACDGTGRIDKQGPNISGIPDGFVLMAAEAYAESESHVERLKANLERIESLNQSMASEPPVEEPAPPVFTDLTLAVDDATKMREILVVLHNGLTLEQQAERHRNIAKVPGTKRFTVLLMDANVLIKGQRAQEFFKAKAPTSAIRFNPITGESKAVVKLSDLEE